MDAVRSIALNVQVQEVEVETTTSFVSYSGDETIAFKPPLEVAVANAHEKSSADIVVLGKPNRTQGRPLGFERVKLARFTGSHPIHMKNNGFEFEIKSPRPRTSKTSFQ